MSVIHKKRMMVFVGFIFLLWLSPVQSGVKITAPEDDEYMVKLYKNFIVGHSGNLKIHTVTVNGKKIKALTVDARANYSADYGERVKKVIFGAFTGDEDLAPAGHAEAGYRVEHVLPKNERKRYVKGYKFNNFPLFSETGLINKCRKHTSEGKGPITFSENFQLFARLNSEDIPGHLGWFLSSNTDLSAAKKKVTITCENIMPELPYLPAGMEYAKVRTLYYEYDCRNTPGTVIQGLGVKHAIVRDTNVVQRDCVNPMVVDKRHKDKIVWKDGDGSIDKWKQKLLLDSIK